MPVAAPAAAQNLLVNGSFGEVLGLTHWTIESSVAEWSSVQCPGFVVIGSGSALLAYDSNASGNPPARISQCVPATPGSRYRLRGDVLVPEDSVGTQAAVTLRAVAGTCESWTSVYYGTTYRYEDSGCQDIDMTMLPPPELDALVVELEVHRQTSDVDAYAYFDGFSLIDLPEPGALAPCAALVALTGLRRHRSATRARRDAATRSRARSSPPTPRAG